jgi:hypothetical protein
VKSHSKYLFFVFIALVASACEKQKCFFTSGPIDSTSIELIYEYRLAIASGHDLKHLIHSKYYSVNRKNLRSTEGKISKEFQFINSRDVNFNGQKAIYVTYFFQSKDSRYKETGSELLLKDVTDEWRVVPIEFWDLEIVSIVPF